MDLSPNFDKTLEASKSAVETELLQFTSSGHILGFETDGIYLATGNHMLRESFANTQGRAPISGFPDVVNGQIVTVSAK